MNKLFTALQLDWKSKLQVFHSCSSTLIVIEHQIGLCFPWDEPSSIAKLQERDLPTSKKKKLSTEQVPYRRANKPKIERFFSCCSMMSAEDENGDWFHF